MRKASLRRRVRCPVTGTRGTLAAALLGVLVCGGCSSRAADDDEPKAAAPGKENAMQLDAQEIENAGIRTIPAASTQRALQLTGYGVVLPHDTIAQSVAELKQAQAVAAQSRTALARARRLEGTPGALSADQAEAAVRQSAVDAAGSELARQKLSGLIGRPALEGRSLDKLLQSLAEGERKILRATFPATGPPLAHGAGLRAIRLGRREPETIDSLGPAWPAPADPDIPGRSYFAVIPGNALAEGERITATALSGETLSGVFVPGAAMVLFDARPWFYVQHPDGAFERLPIEAERHVEGGYALEKALAASDRIVIQGAGILLAREQGAGEPD